MPTYEFMCHEGHQFDIWCSISSKPEHPPCPVEVRYPVPMIAVMCEEHEPGCTCKQPVPQLGPCEAPSKQVFLTPPTTWIAGVDHKTVLDYPGSKAQKAGHVHSHGFKYGTKVSSGAGGMINPRTSTEAPVASNVIPDYKTSTKRWLRKEGLL
jgi:hypothetical protein